MRLTFSPLVCRFTIFFSFLFLVERLFLTVLDFCRHIHSGSLYLLCNLWIRYQIFTLAPFIHFVKISFLSTHLFIYSFSLTFNIVEKSNKNCLQCLNHADLNYCGASLSAAWVVYYLIMKPESKKKYSGWFLLPSRKRHNLFLKPVLLQRLLLSKG